MVVTLRLAFLSLLVLASVGGLAAEKKSPPESRAVLRQHPDVLLRRAYRAGIEGDNTASIAYFERYFAVGPESAYARGQFARVLSRQGLHKRAVIEAARAVTLQPGAEYEVLYAAILRRAGKSRLALTRLGEAARKFPGDIRLEMHLAETYYLMRRRKQALVHYRQVLFLAGARGQAHYRNRALWRLANIHLRANNLPKSQFYFVRYSRQNPRNIFARFVLGYYLYFRRGQYDRALRELEGIARYPEADLRRFRIRPQLLYSAVGEVYFLKKDHRARHFLRKAFRGKRKNYLDFILLMVLDGKDRKAFRYLNSYLRIHSRDFIARVARIRILERMNVPAVTGAEYFRVALLAARIGQHRLGLDLCRQALALAEKHPKKLGKLRSPIYQQIARHNEAMGRPHLSIHYLRLALDQGDRDGRWKLPRATGKGEQARAAAQRKLLLRRHRLTLGLARILASHRVRRYQAAMDVLAEVIAAAPDFGRAYYVRGVVLNRMKRNQQAIADFGRAIRLDGKQSLYFFFRAIAHHDRKDIQATETDLKMTLKLRPRFAEAANFLGYIYAERGIKLDDSLRLIRRAIDIQPTNGAYQDSLGWVYYRRGRYQEARYHLQLAALLLEESKDDDAVVFDHLGDVYHKLGLTGKAVSAYRRALHTLDQKARKEGPLDAESRALRAKIQGKLKRLLKI